MTIPNRSRWAALAFCTLVLALAAAPALAQTYPSKPVKVIVTFPPGGTPDIYGRLLAQELAAHWKQPVVVENKTGASGTLGTDFVAKAAPDGYTLLFAADSVLTIAPNLYNTIPYSPTRDLTPIINAVTGPLVMLANASFPANDIKGLIALAKQQPGKITYASSGPGGPQHLSMEMVKGMADIDVTHIPYKGFGQGINDVMAGHVPLIFGGITASIGLLKGGKLKALGVTSLKRSKALPQVPAISETLTGFAVDSWYGFLGPRGMPPDLVRKIHNDVAQIIARPDFQARLAADALEPVANSSEEFATQISADLASWGKVIKALGLKLDQ